MVENLTVDLSSFLHCAMPQRSVTIHVAGKVQGVFFRKSAQWHAESLNIRGHACNLPDGRVRIEAEGPQEEVDRFIDWCHQGPSDARVDEVLVEDVAWRDLPEFHVI